jgi:hypothetical protein
MPVIQFDFFLYKTEAFKNTVGSMQKREGERDREEWINGVRGRGESKIRNGVGWEVTVGKGHWSISNKLDK